VKKKIILHAVSWALSLAILAVLLWLLDLHKLGRRLAEADLGAAAGVLVLIIVLFTIKGVRWWVIVRAEGSAPVLSCIRLHFVSVFLNAFIPLRGGDVARGLLLARETGIGRAQALGTVALDKLFDMIMLAVLVVPLLFLGGLPEWIRWPPVVTVCTAVGLLIAGLVLRLRMRRRGEDLEEARLPVRILAGFARGFDSALRPGPTALCLLLSTVQYAILVFTMVLGLISVGIEPDPETSILSILAVQFSAGVPLTPSSAGTMHGAIVAVLAAVGTDPETGMSAAVVYHAAQTLPILVLGVVFTRGTALGQALDETSGRGS
jgi:uncharacterized protein (TIRG00374 family)